MKQVRSDMLEGDAPITPTTLRGVPDLRREPLVFWRLMLVMVSIIAILMTVLAVQSK